MIVVMPGDPKPPTSEPSIHDKLFRQYADLVVTPTTFRSFNTRRLEIWESWKTPDNRTFAYNT